MVDKKVKTAIKYWKMADSNFEVHDKTLHCLNIAIQEFTWQKNLVKIGLELSILEPIQQGDFFVPNLDLKKLMLRIWQRLL